MNSWGSKIIKIALYTSLVESLIGIAVFAVYLLFHFCAVQVKCPDKRMEEVAFVFYTTYIKNKDSCSISSPGNEDIGHISTNPNKLTKAEIIFYWQIILLVLHLGLAGTSLLLQRVHKESQAGLPWLFFMGLLILVDLVASSLTMTDFKYPEFPVEQFSCPLSSDWAKTRRYLTISTLALIFSRGVLLWIFNLYLFISVSRISLNFERSRPEYVGKMTDDYWPAYPGPQSEVDEDERDVTSPVMTSFQPEPRPAAGHPPRDHSSRPEIRRAPSFAERLREAETNPNNKPTRTGSQLWSYTGPADKTELRNRGQVMKSYRPDQDVDTAFDFLDSYSLREDSNTSKKSVNLSHILENNSQDIPRARVPEVAGPHQGEEMTGRAGERGQGAARYFVPLKH